MNRKKLIKFCFLALLIQNCSNSNNLTEFERALLSFEFKETTELNRFKVIVIPNEGCNGCISWATLEAKEKIDTEKNLHIIFTGVQDLKLFKNSIGLSFFDHNRVLIDTSNILMKPNLSSIYPRIIDIENNRVKFIDEFSDTKQLIDQ